MATERLEDIGFYTLSDARARSASASTPLLEEGPMTTKKAVKPLSKAENDACEAGLVVQDRAVEWANADGPAERQVAEQRLHEATREFQRLADIAWGDDPTLTLS